MPMTMGSHGMWQVAGGRGKIDQKKAAEEMKRYCFAGLGVFDTADVCEFCGFLSKKYSGRPEPKKFELTTQSLSKYKRTIDQRDGGWMLFQELLLVLSQLADQRKVSISNVAVHDIAHKPAVAAVINGARLSIAEHITSNQATFSFPGLDQGDVALIHAVVEKGDGIAGDCGDEYRWPPKTGSKFAMLLVDEGKPRFQFTKPQGIAKLGRARGERMSLMQPKFCNLGILHNDRYKDMIGFSINAKTWNSAC